MAVYRITAPDGSEFDVTAPDTATEAEVMAYAQQQFARQAKPKSAEELTPGISTNPTDGMSGAQRFAAGAGKSAADTPHGARQLFTEMASLVTPFYARGGLDPEIARLRSESDRRAQQDAPLMATGAGLAGNITGQAGQLFAAPGSSATLLGKIGLAGAQGAGYAAMQPVGAEDSRTVATAVGGGLGALGQGVASGLGVLARGAKARLDPYTREMADKAEQIGMRLGLGHLTDNPQVRNVISQMERLPFSGARASREANQGAFNAAAGEQMGVASRKLTPEVFAQGKRAISDEFERLTAQNDLRATPELMQRLSQIAADAERKGTSDSARMVRGYIEDLIGRAGPDGRIPGQAYQALDSELGQTLKAGGDPARWLGPVRDAVREAMDSSISPADRAAWALARSRWAAMKVLEPLVAKSAGSGDIPMAQLLGRTTADRAGKARMAADRGGALGELANVGSRFGKTAPDSGTADRLAVNLGVLGALGTGAQQGVISPETAAYSALFLGANRGALAALRSKGLLAGESRALNGLARLVQTAQPQRTLPAAAAANAAATPLDIGTVDGYDPRYPRY